jgi:hypothetical protein
MLNPSDGDALAVAFLANNWCGVFRSNRLIPSAGHATIVPSGFDWPKTVSDA